jgi:recombinational DNA repair protein RecT
MQGYKKKWEKMMKKELIEELKRQAEGITELENALAGDKERVDRTESLRFSSLCAE